MLEVGITGGIGSGKSLVCSIFQKLGIPIFNADESSKNLLNQNQNLKSKLIDEFGSEIFDIQGFINKRYFADIIFNNPDKLQKANSIIHPFVKNDYDKWKANYLNYKYILKEAAILIESSSYKQLDYLIVITAPLELRIKRVIERDSTTKEAVEARINKQLSDNEKVNLANFVIINDEKEMLIPQIIKIHNSLINNNLK